MHRPPTAAYKAKNQDQIREHMDLADARWAAYQDHIKTMQAELGKEGLMAFTTMPLGARLTGYTPDSPSEEPLPGFRYDRKLRYMVPAKRTPEGKEAHRRLTEVTYSRGSVPGLGEMVFGAGRMQPWHLREIAGEWYAYLTIPLDDGQPRPFHLNPGGAVVGDIDLELWDKLNLSQYLDILEREEQTA